MKEFETRKCDRCGHVMQPVDGSDRTMRDKVWFNLRCPWCGHVEVDWYVRKRKSD